MCWLGFGKDEKVEVVKGEGCLTGSTPVLVAAPRPRPPLPRPRPRPPGRRLPPWAFAEAREPFFGDMVVGDIINTGEERDAEVKYVD